MASYESGMVSYDSGMTSFANGMVSYGSGQAFLRNQKFKKGHFITISS